MRSRPPPAPMLALVLFLALAAGAAGLVASARPAKGGPPTPPRPHPQQPQPPPPGTDPAAAAAEPTVVARLARRARVFSLAARVFLSYKRTERAERRMRRELGLPTAAEAEAAEKEGGGAAAAAAADEAAEHPDLVALWDAAHERNAGRILASIEGLRGFWIKVGQYLSSRADVMPPQYLGALARLQDGVPANPYGDVLTTLREDLTEEQLARFGSIDPVPLSAASLAQVHRATLVDGRDVVVKVQHRGVASLMTQDMANLRTILGLLAVSDPGLDFGPVVDEYTAEVGRELDFRLEAASMEEVRKLLGSRGVRARVPEAVPGLVTRRVLTMEYCEGFSIRDVERLDGCGADREMLLRRVCTSWAVQMHLGGVFNADPHAGNLLVSTAEEDGDPSVPVLLDFGLTKRLDSGMRLAFARLVHSTDENDLDGLLLAFEEMGLVLNRYDPFEDMAAMQRGYSDPVPQSQAKEASKEKAKDRKKREAAMKDDQGTDKRGKLRSPVDAWPAELIFFTRVSAMLRGLCSRLEVPYPYLGTMAGTARQALREAVPENEQALSIVHPSADDHESRLQDRMRSIAEDLVNQGHAVGLQCCVLLHGNVVANVAAGTLGTADSRPVTPSTLFNAFSVSKALLAAGLNLLLQREGIDADDPVAAHWPEFGSRPDKARLTIRQALTHQAGLADAFPENGSIDLLTDWDEMKAFIASADAIPAHPPGEETRYHYISFAWIIGGLIEAITGQPYETYLSENIIHPSGLDSQIFMGGITKEIGAERLAVLTMRATRTDRPSSGRPGATPGGDQGKKGRKVVLEKFRAREQMLNPTIFNFRKVREAKLPSANGHFSAEALATVFHELVIGSDWRPPLLNEATIEAARAPQACTGEEKATRGAAPGSALLDNDQAAFGLGFQVHDIRTEDGMLVRSLGHAGVGGSIVLCLPEVGVSIALTANQLGMKSVARERFLAAIFDEYRLERPRSLID